MALQFLGNRSLGRRKLVTMGKNEASVFHQIWKLSRKIGRISQRSSTALEEISEKLVSQLQ